MMSFIPYLSFFMSLATWFRTKQPISMQARALGCCQWSDSVGWTFHWVSGWWPAFRVHTFSSVFLVASLMNLALPFVKFLCSFSPLMCPNFHLRGEQTEDHEYTECDSHLSFLHWQLLLQISVLQSLDYVVVPQRQQSRKISTTWDHSICSNQFNFSLTRV